MFFWLIILALGCLYYLLKKPYNYWKNLGVNQGDPYIIVGDNYYTFFRKKSNAELIKYFYEMFPKSRYSGVYRFTFPMMVIRDPELIKSITVKDFDHFTDHRSFVDPESEPLFAKNLLGLKGQQWKDMRATLTGSFSSSKMKLMFGLVTEAAQNFVEYFEKQDQSELESEVEVKDLFTRLTIDVIATTAFGVKVDSLREKNNEFYVMGKAITEIGGSIARVCRILLFFMFPKIYKLLKLRLIDKDVTDFFETLIKETIKLRVEKNIVRPDMINILMEAQKEAENERYLTKESTEHHKTRHHHQEITIDDIIAQAVIFFFAGFDSVSSLMTFTSYELAVNQNVQDKLREEIRETSEKCGGKVTYEELMNMKYLDMVITEALRKWPPFGSMDRECTKTYTITPKLPGEKYVQIKKGSAVLIPVFGIHRDPEYYPNPEKFDPERFSPENKEKLVPYTLLGFGSGPRSCIGSRFAQMEVKAMLFYLLSKFKLVTTENTQIPLVLDKKFSVIIRPEKGVFLGIKRL